jgi:NADH dehydrogenase
MSSRVFVTGASGFVGTAVVRELGRRGYHTTALSRDAEVVGASTVRAALFDAARLTDGMAGSQAVIHLVGIIAERPSEGVTFRRVHVDGTERILAAAKAAGVRRYIHMSALGTRPGAASEYHRTKWAAEERVRASGLEWTIIRPSMIHGPGGEFMRMLAGWARGTKAPYFFMPYFGAGATGRAGSGKLQPVYVNDVARAFADAIEKPETTGREYEIGGATPVTWRDLHRLASREIVGRQRAAIPIPAWYAKLLARVVPAGLLPFNRDQVIMSQEDNTCDLTPFRRDFGWEPAGFVETLRAYAREL